MINNANCPSYSENNISYSLYTIKLLQYYFSDLSLHQIIICPYTIIMIPTSYYKEVWGASYFWIVRPLVRHTLNMVKNDFIYGIRMENKRTRILVHISWWLTMSAQYELLWSLFLRPSATYFERPSQVSSNLMRSLLSKTKWKYVQMVMVH